jgi:hypothetical protein
MPLDPLQDGSPAPPCTSPRLLLAAADDGVVEDADDLRLKFDTT